MILSWLVCVCIFIVPLVFRNINSSNRVTYICPREWEGKYFNGFWWWLVLRFCGNFARIFYEVASYINAYTVGLILLRSLLQYSSSICNRAALWYLMIYSLAIKFVFVTSVLSLYHCDNLPNYLHIPWDQILFVRLLREIFM